MILKRKNKRPLKGNVAGHRKILFKCQKNLNIGNMSSKKIF